MGSDGKRTHVCVVGKWREMNVFKIDLQTDTNSPRWVGVAVEDDAPDAAGLAA